MEQSGKLLFITPPELTQGEIIYIQLPRNKMPFMITHDNLYSIQKSSFFGSSVINSFLNSNTDIYFVTSFDPIFLLLPILSQKYAFRNYKEVLSDANLLFLLELSKIREKVLCFCESKEHQGELYVRCSEDRINEFLRTKFEILEREIIINVPWAMSVQGNTQNAGKVTMGIFYELLHDEFFVKITGGLKIQEILSCGKPQPYKRIREKEVENEKPLKEAKKIITQKVVKIERGQKSISGFFKPKAK